MNTAIICINGIRARASSSRGWTDEFVTALNTRTPASVKVEKFEYDCSALLRRLHQRARVDEVARMANRYRHAGYRVVLVGHSNGCDIIARVLLLNVEVDTVHLFAPAADEEDFEQVLLYDGVRRIHIYGSQDDHALKGASLSRKLIGWLGLGYGSLGLRGAEFAAKHPGVVRDHSIHGYGHSTWFTPGFTMEQTLKLLLANDADDVKELEGPPTQKLPETPTQETPKAQAATAAGELRNPFDP